MADGSLIIKTEAPPVALWSLTFQPDPFRPQDRVQATFAHGATLEQAIGSCLTPETRPFTRVWIEGHEVAEHLWSRVRPNAGVVVTAKTMTGAAAVVPLVAALSSSLVTASLTGLVATSLGALTLTSQIIIGVAGALTAFAVSALGSALFAPSQGRERQTEEPTYLLNNARQTARRYGPIPVVLGTHKIVPDYGGLPVPSANVTENFLRFVVIWGYGPVNVSDIKIGNTALSEFDDVTVDNDFAGTETDLKHYPSDRSYDSLNIALTTSFQTRTTAANTRAIRVTLTWTNGLVRFNKKGKKEQQACPGAGGDIVIQYRENGSGDPWTTIFENQIFGRTTEPRVRSFGVNGLDAATYDVRFRISADLGSAQNPDLNIIDDVFVTGLESINYRDPVNISGVAKSSYFIRATDQLNGVVDQLNGVVSLKIPTWNGSAWTGSSATSNPAAIYRYIHIGAAGGERFSASRMADDNLGEWYDFCDQRGLAYDRWINFRTTIEEIRTEVAAAGWASPTLIEGKWGVVIDRPTTTVTQHFTPRNISNFTGQALFSEVPHALRCRFFNENRDYQEDERIVYDDGYNAATATEFEVVELPGQTNPRNVYRHARRMLAAMRLRPEIFSFEVDFEHLVCTRGDRVKITHDAALAGQKAARVKSISSPNIVIDDVVTMVGGTNYGLDVRTADGTFTRLNIETSAGTGSTLEVSSTSALATAVSNGFAAGDLVAFGERNAESLDAIVTEIEPVSELGAKITCVPYNADVYSSADEIPEYEAILSTPASGSLTGPPTPIVEYVISNETSLRRTPNGTLIPAILVYFRVGDTTVPSTDRTRRSAFVQARYRPFDVDDPYVYTDQMPADGGRIEIVGVEASETYRIQIRAVDDFGGTSKWANMPLHTVTGDEGPPPDVSSFGINSIGDHTYVNWTYDNPPGDLVRFEIRYSPSQSVTTWGAMIPLSEQVPAGAREFTVPSRSGSYGIKAVDFFQNKSANALFINASLEDPAALNVVETITEAPGFSGTKTDTAVGGSGLQLGSIQTMSDWDTLAEVVSMSYGVDDPEGETSGFVDEGTYAFGETDLSEVYTSRVTPSISATALNIQNTMATWATLAEVADLSGAASVADDLGVVLEYAYSIVDSATPSYGDWRRLNAVTDVTFRHIKFRLRLTTIARTITPVVTALSVSIDMPDRIWRDEDRSSGTGGDAVTFSPSFAATPSITIAAQDMGTGDYYAITSRSREGCTVEFFNSGATSVDRTYDIQAIGYGRERGT